MATTYQLLIRSGNLWTPIEPPYLTRRRAEREARERFGLRDGEWIIETQESVPANVMENTSCRHSLAPA